MTDEKLETFSKKSEHVFVCDSRGTLKVNDSHLGNATICQLSEYQDFWNAERW